MFCIRVLRKWQHFDKDAALEMVLLDDEVFAKMSSAQVSRVKRSNKVSAKHATRLNEMLSEMAKEKPIGGMPIYGLGTAILSSGSNNQDWVRALPKCSIGNYTPSHVSFLGEKSWAGSVVGTYPNRIAMNATGGFRTHNVDDSEGAVIYVGTNGYSECAFVLAWMDTCFGKLVYVEAGPCEDYGCPPWDTIRNKLKEYGGTQSYYKDNRTGAEVSAKIGDGCDFIAAAAFDITTN